MNILESSWFPSLLAFASVSLATYVVVDFFSYVSVRYRDRYLQEASTELDDILIQMPAGRILDLSLALSAIALLITVLLTMTLGDATSWKGGLMLGLLAAGAVFPVPRFLLRFLRKRRLRKFNEQLEDVLMSMSSSLKAGFSINQAIDEIASMNRPPISVEFRLLSQECRLGVPLTQALENMNRRLGSEDFELVATAIITARQTGGELTATLERLAALIRERLRITGKIHAMTAMGRLQAYLISSMPFLLIIGIFQVAPSLFDGVFDSFIGYGMIAVVVVLDVLGFIVIRKITAIDI